MHSSASRSPQSGVALIVALIMLLLITLIGLAAAKTQTTEVRMSANTQNRDIAMQQAEAALRYAQSLMPQINAQTFVAAPVPAGYYITSLNGGMPQYNCISTWANYAGDAACGALKSAVTAAYAGPALPGNSASGTASFIIELLPSVAPQGTSLNEGPTRLPPPVAYRVTANGVGADGSSSVRLQAVFH